MLRFADPCGLFYSTTAQATSGLYTSLSATIATSGLPSGNVGATAFQNLSTAIVTVPNSPGPYFYGTRYVPTETLVFGQLFAFLDASGNPQVTFVTNLNGTISAYRGSFSGTLLGTSSTSVEIIENVWQYLEFGCTCDPTNGTVDIRINGTSVLHLTGVNTQGSSTTTIGACKNFGGNVTNFVQDSYICDGTGTYNNNFLGDVHVSAYAPVSNGIYTQYTPNGAASLYECVNAATPTDSTVFASDSNPGDKMSVNLAPTSVAGTIAGVIVVGRMEKTDSGTRTAKLLALNGGTEVDGSSIALGTSYAYFTEVLETDPATGVPWVNAGFNAAQIGVETAS
jgi:hypothetical protein